MASAGGLRLTDGLPPKARGLFCGSPALLQTDELSEHEMQAVEEMLNRLSDELLNSGNDGKP